MNAARSLIAKLPRHTVVRVLEKLGDSALPADTPALQGRLCRHLELDLAALLNHLKKDELDTLAETLRLPESKDPGALRAALWRFGAVSEARGDSALGSPWQPVPVELSGKLVFLGPIRGLEPPACGLPRPVPDPAGLPLPAEEPDCLEELLERATSLVGYRLGARGPDKGIYGTRVAALLGLCETGFAEPDWRGDVEVKTVPVIRDTAGLWRVKEDPAISMDGVRPMSKLSRVLWIARVADQEDSPILSWYYQEWDSEVARMALRHLHKRPKGAKGTNRKGWYLRKHFFTESGFLRSLNGSAVTPSCD